MLSALTDFYSHAKKGIVYSIQIKEKEKEFIFK